MLTMCILRNRVSKSVADVPSLDVNQRSKYLSLLKNTRAGVVGYGQFSYWFKSLAGFELTTFRIIRLLSNWWVCESMDSCRLGLEAVVARSR